MRSLITRYFADIAGTLIVLLLITGCGKKEEVGGFGDAASKVYVAPGSYDEFYAFMSGGFSGQVSV